MPPNYTESTLAPGARVKSITVGQLFKREECPTMADLDTSSSSLDPYGDDTASEAPAVELNMSRLTDGLCRAFDETIERNHLRGVTKSEWPRPLVLLEQALDDGLIDELVGALQFCAGQTESDSAGQESAIFRVFDNVLSSAATAKLGDDNEEEGSIVAELVNRMADVDLGDIDFFGGDDDIIIEDSPDDTDAVEFDEGMLLHRAAFIGNVKEIELLLAEGGRSLRQYDYHGNTPLHIAVIQRHTEVARALILHGADVAFPNEAGWSALDEAVVKKDKAVLHVLLEESLHQRRKHWEEDKKQINEWLKAAPDFYIQFKWNLSSSVLPLVKRALPHDNYTIWKQGNKVRIDSESHYSDVLGWLRSSLSVMYDGDSSEAHKEFILVDRDRKRYGDCLYRIRDPTTKNLMVQGAEMIRKQAIQDTIDVNQVKFKEKVDWITNRVKQMSIANSLCDLYDASGNMFTVTKTRVKKRRRLPNYEVYFDEMKGAAANASKPSFSLLGALTGNSPASRRKSQTTVTNVSRTSFKMSTWLRDVGRGDLHLDDIKPLTTLLCHINPHVKMVKQLLEIKFPEHKFPMAASVPIMLFINLNMNITKLEVGLIDDSKFDLDPSKYTLCDFPKLFQVGMFS